MFKKLPPETSIRKRLILYIGSGLLLAWFAANAVSLAMALHELNESADSQMSDLAQSLPYIEPEKAVLLPKVKKSLGKGHTGFAEDKQNGISVWNADGRLLLSDKRGKEIPFRKISGFTDIGKPWQEKSLRVIYYHDGKTGQTVAVAQPWRNRLEILWNIVWAHLAASLLVLPLMVLLLHLAVKRSIYPLKELASELSERRADNLAPVSRAVPQETQTLVDALNRLFARVQTSIEREQRFTSDAAHELRSPLAALKVQTEVLALSDTAEQPYHLQQIQQSLNRAEHLINQLLTLARLDPEQGLKNTTPINWESLSSQVLQNTNLSAREKRIRLKRDFAGHPLPLQGDPVLLQLMLRNLIDNAVRYSPEESEVGLYFYPDRIEIRDHGAGIAAEHLPRIKERFYRPAGQNGQGSGLGLSIVEQIAALHGLTLRLENRREGGLSAWIEQAV